MNKILLGQRPSPPTTTPTRTTRTTICASCIHQLDDNFPHEAQVLEMQEANGFCWVTKCSGYAGKENE